MKCLPAVLFAASSLLSQGVVIAPAVARPSVCIASAGPQWNSQVMPTGPMARGGTFSAQIHVPSVDVVAFTQWDTYTGDTFARFSFYQAASSGGYAGGYALSDFELLLQLSSSVPTPVMISLGHATNGGAGSTLPSLSVDIGDDGYPELLETSVGVRYVSVGLGPQPIAVRIRMAASAAGVASGVDQQMIMQLVPVYPIACDRVMLGCDINSLPCVQTFAGEIELDTSLNLWPGLLVFGLGIQATPLPASVAVSPLCLLLPSPDVVLLVPPAPHRLSIPARVRPLTLWTQEVVLTPQGLATTDGYRIEAR